MIKILFTALTHFAVFLLFAGYAWYVQTLSANIPDTDPYYHIKLASILRNHGIIHEFPWTQFSSWKAGFFDKDFLFHVILIPFAQGDLVWGAKIANCFLVGMFGLSFYCLLNLSNIRFALFWTLLLFGAGFHFWNRMFLLRPALISIPLLLYGTLSIVRGWKISAFLLTAIYVLSYNAAFLLPLVALLFFIISIIFREENKWRILLAVLLGFLAGILAHPYRTTMWENFWIQNMYVLLSSWGDRENIRSASELSSLGAREFILHTTLSSLCAFVSMLYPLLRNIRVSSAQVTFLFLQLIFFVLTALSQRFIEYWVPLSVFSLAFIIATPQKMAVQSNRVTRMGCYVVMVISLVAVGFMFNKAWPVTRLIYMKSGKHAGEDAALWMQTNIPKNEIVFTCDWDDSPHLFFFNDQNRYLVMADPNYFYRWNEKLWSSWITIGRGEDPLIYENIGKLFKADYVYCTSEFSSFINQVSKHPGFEQLYADKSSVIFKRLPDYKKEPELDLDDKAPLISNYKWSGPFPYSELGRKNYSHYEWRPITNAELSSEQVVNLIKLPFTEKIYSCVKLKSEVEIVNSQEYILEVRADDAYSITVNNHQRLTSKRNSSIQDNLEEIAIRLNAGRNEFFFTVCNATGDWKFQVKLKAVRSE